jgi:uncharacterized OB-fold protein
MTDLAARLLPRPTPETAHFWSGTTRGQLLIQRCADCDKAYFPPRPFCPACSSRNVHVIPASGAATLLSYVISARPAPGLEAPYSVAIVRLAEGPTMMSNVINCPQTPEHLQLDMPLQVVFVRQTADITLPLFEPAGRP